MARARVTLMGCETFSGEGHLFKKGESKVTANPSDILYFKGHPEFSVEELHDPVPAAASARVVAKPKKASPTSVKSDPGPADTIPSLEELVGQTKTSLLKFADEQGLSVDTSKGKPAIAKRIRRLLKERAGAALDDQEGGEDATEGDESDDETEEDGEGEEATED